MPDFMPHGYCFQWDPLVLWLHVISDGIIVLSYFCIPVALVYLARKRRDLPFNWIFWMFALFIMGCGATHLLEIWTIWHANYLLSGIVKAITAVASAATAILLIPLIPKVIALPSGDQLHAVTYELRLQVIERERAEEKVASTQAERERVQAALAEHQCALEDLQLAQSALHRSQGQLTAIIQSAMDAIITIDEDQRVVIFNAAAEKMFGCTLAEATGKSLERFIPQRFHQGHAEHIHRFAHTGVSNRAMAAQGAIWGVRSNGEEFPLEASISQVQSGSRKLFTVILRDITEQKRIALALAEQAEELALSRRSLEVQTLMLQSVLDSISEGLVAADETGKFILWNPAATRIIGLGAANVPPEQWTDHYGTYLPDTVTPFPPEQNPLLRAIRGEACTAEMYVRNAKLETGVWIESSASPLKGKDGVARGGVVAFRNVTQRRLYEREIRKLNDELEARVIERTVALQAANHELEAFTYSVSHDLRAPLRHISGFSRILLEDFAPSLPAEAQRHLQRIAQGAARMGKLVDELLNLARVGRQSLTIEPTRLSSIVQDVLALLEPEIAGRNVEWKISDLPVLECDSILVRQVFQNLIHNALKYSRPRSPAVIEIGQTEKNGQPVIFISDNGVGFSMKYADKLFGVFQRLHRAEEFEGTGVGLAIVQRIIHKHGGRVWAEAEIDRGATFYFTLGSCEHSESKTIAAAATSGDRT
jgi:PAS domain S-box-containing protein